jgi:hypothetical protein
MQIGRGDHDQQRQAAGVDHEMPFAAIILSPPILQVRDLVCCVVDGVLDGFVSRVR